MLPTILPKPSPRSNQEDPGHDPPASKRKRSLVALACAACRKRKTKCDGRRPVCTPCEQRHLECVFDFPDDVPAARRGRKTIEKLSKANLDLNNVIEALRSGTEEQALAIVREIRANDTLQQHTGGSEGPHAAPSRANVSGQGLSGTNLISSRFETDTEPDQSNYRDPRLGPRRRLSTALSREGEASISQTGRYSSTLQESTDAVDILPISKWTIVTGSDRQLNELLTLLWTWDTTFVRVIDRESFEADLRAGALDDQRDSPKRQFCSIFLVNTLLGFACTYAIGESIFDEDEDPLSKARLFVEQAEARIERMMSNPSFDLLQGLTILYAYEARIGYGKLAKSYVEKVFYIYKCLEFDEEEVEEEVKASELDAEEVRRAKSKILWGLYMFDWKLSHTYGQRKRLGKPSVAKIWQSTSLQADQVDYWWRQRRSYYNEVFDAECSLVEIAEDILVYVYPNATDRKETSAVSYRAFQLYTRLVEWKLWFMEVVPEEANELPQTFHVLYCYEMLVVVLLRKVAHLTKEEFGTNIDPQALCYAHTNNIMSILWTYRALYTIRFECWVAQACSLVAFSTIFHLGSDTVILDSFERVCRVLYEVSTVYPLGLDFLFSIRVMVQQHHIKVSKTVSKYLAKATGPRQLELTEEWRALILLGKTDGVRGGIKDVTLGDLIDGFAGLATTEE